MGYHRPDNPEIVTPVLDSLVQEGVEIDRLYAYKVNQLHSCNISSPPLQPNQFCSPSRCSLLTGRLPVHVNFHNDDQRLPDAGIPEHMSTMATKLKELGYATHQVGKV